MSSVTMNKTLQRMLMAYRPLYLHGLLRDGNYRMPRLEPEAVNTNTWVRQRSLLTALTHLIFHYRSK